MPKLEIVAFSEEHLDGAAALLAERHRTHRRAEPLLSERFEDAASARHEIAAIWRSDAASGAAALRDGRVVGFLLGVPHDEAVWGPNVWIDAAGHAAEEPETVRDAYAIAAARWADEGRTRHYALVPAFDARVLDAWYRLCFGQQQAHGLREVPPETGVDVPDGFEIREPDLADLDRLIELDLALPRHQQGAPVFSNRPLPTPEECRREWHDTLTAGTEDVLLGYCDGRPVACWSILSVEHSRMHTGLAAPDRAAYLAFAVTLPEFRGSGIGVALTDAVLARAAEQGYPAMVTDWRVTNLLASRFWPRRGFRTSFLRLYRSIP